MRTVIILLILCGAGYYWHHNKTRFEEFESLEGAVRRAQNALNEKGKEREKVLEKLEPLRRAKAEAEGKGTSVEQVQQELDALQKELESAATRLDAAEAEFVSEMQAVRDHAKTKTIPAIKLVNGDELKECQISKFGEGYVSITHSEGVRKVPADDLPEGWVARYSLDYVPRDAEADKEAIETKIEEVTLTDAQVKSLKIAEVEEQLKVVDAQLLAFSHQVRDKSRLADKLVRDAYRIKIQSGAQAAQSIAERRRMMEESKAQEGQREAIRAKYRSLREKKLALEKRRNDLRARPGN